MQRVAAVREQIPNSFETVTKLQVEGVDDLIPLPPSWRARSARTHDEIETYGMTVIEVPLPGRKGGFECMSPSKAFLMMEMNIG